MSKLDRRRIVPDKGLDIVKPMIWSEKIERMRGDVKLCKWMAPNKFFERVIVRELSR